MKRLDQGHHLYPLPEHPEAEMSRPGMKPGPPSSQASTLAIRTRARAIRTAYAIAFRYLYTVLIVVRIFKATPRLLALALG